MKKVGLIIPTYNPGNDLRDALASIMAQTYKDFCVVVIDDASTQDVKEIVEEFSDKFDIYYLKNGMNKGVSYSRQRGLDYLKDNPTEYVMFLDSDDSLMPYAFEGLVACFEHNENVDIVDSNFVQDLGYGQQKIISGQGNRTWLHGRMFRLAYLVENNIRFPTDLRSNEDVTFCLVACSKTENIYYWDKATYFWKKNMNSITRSQTLTMPRKKCMSCDYIDAIYYAYRELKKGILPRKVIWSIFCSYNSYQNGIIFKTLTQKQEERIAEMLNNKQVLDVIVEIYSMDTDSFSINQWIQEGENITFYRETFGVWIMRYVNQEKLKKVIQEKLERDSTTGR